MDHGKVWVYVVVFVVCVALLLFVTHRLPMETHSPSLVRPQTMSQVETMGFDETEVNADVAVIAFRIQAFAPDDESKARYEFLRKLQDIEAQCHDREIPFQLIPKSSEPFVFVQSSQTPPAPTNVALPSDILHQPPIPPRSKLYSITQDFSLPLLLIRSPPIPLFLDTLASNGALISNISFPISAQRKNGAEKASLLKAVADAKSKATFLANEQQRVLGNIVEITPVQVKIEQVKDANLDLLMGQLEQQQQKYQLQQKIEQQQREQPVNPYALMVNPMMQHQQQLAMSMGLGMLAPTPPSMDPLKVFSSSLVPKKVLITTQVRVKFACL